jgi:hypothetical protein
METLLPTIGDRGENWNEQQAIANYLRTGKHLGRYKTVEESNKAAEKLHLEQELIYNDPEILRLLRRLR